MLQLIWPLVRGCAQAGAGALAFLAMTVSAVRAEPLATEACSGLAAEHEGLVKAGLPETLKRGAAWGKANLSPDKLKEVQRFIALEEQLLFRCGHDKLRAKLAKGGEAEEGEEPKEAASDKPPLPKRNPKPQQPAKAADGAPAAAVAKGTAPTRPKPKVDDAYRPPAQPPQPK